MVKLYRDNNTKIFNPETGRYVKVTGTIGRRLERMTDDQYNNLGGGAGAGAGVDEGGVKVFSADRKKVLNPQTNKFVLVTGTLGRKLLRMPNDEYNNLLLRERPAPRQVKPPVDLKKVIREEQAKAIVRGVQRGDEYLERFRQQTVRLFDELPELIDGLVTIPRPTHNIRDVARMLIRPVLERSDTAETIPDMPLLERQETKLQQIEPEDLTVINEVADRLDDMIDQLENEFDVGVEESKVEESKLEDVIVEQIQKKRKDRLNEIINNAQEGELSTEEEWERVFEELYELEPVNDDNKGFTQTWEEFADNLEKMFDEMIAEEKEEVGFEEQKQEKEEKEQKQEEKQEMSGEDALEALRQNLMNLEFLNGRGPYQAHISNPDPHVDAFEHIEKHK
jgi:hypothetical protein